MYRAAIRDVHVYLADLIFDPDVKVVSLSESKIASEKNFSPPWQLSVRGGHDRRERAQVDQVIEASLMSHDWNSLLLVAAGFDSDVRKLPKKTEVIHVKGQKEEGNYEREKKQETCSSIITSTCI